MYDTWWRTLLGAKSSWTPAEYMLKYGNACMYACMYVYMYVYMYALYVCMYASKHTFASFGEPDY